MPATPGTTAITTEGRDPSNDLLRAIFEASTDATLVFDDDLRFVDANPAACRLYGMPYEEILGRRLGDSMPPEIAVDLRERWSRLEPGGKLTGTMPVRDADGATRIVELHCRARIIPGRHLATLRDVTEREAQAAALAESEERFRGAFESAATGMGILAPNGRWIRANRSICRMVGYSEEELRELTFQAITHPDDIEKDLEQARASVDGRIDEYQMEKRYIHKDGSVVWVLLSTAIVRRPNGTPLYFVSHIQDITERRRLEHELQETVKMDAVGRLAGGIAHEFNNLLTAIIGYSEFLTGGFPDGDPRIEDVEAILTAASRAQSLTSQLLALGRRQMSRPEPVQAHARLRALADRIRAKLPTNIDVRFDPDSEPLIIHVDPAQLDAIVFELAFNARDAMPTGGRLTFRTRVRARATDQQRPGAPEPAERGGEPASGRAFGWIDVTDTGAGISESVRQQIFEPFFTTRPRPDARGLGLPTVYGIVRQAGGAIAIDSAPGLGTTVSIGLPAAISSGATAAPLTRAPESSADAQSGAASIATILLVEDEPSLMRLVEIMLSRSGYRVITAGNGRAALDRLAAVGLNRVDLLLTDVLMPGMTGRELAERLHAERADLPVLYMSGYAEQVLTTSGMLPPGVDLIEKPFHPERLVEAVKAKLDRR